MYTKVINTELSNRLHFIISKILDRDIRDQFSQIIKKKN